MGTNADQNPKNAFADPDGDGIPNVDDPAPCEAKTTPYNAVVDINPATLPVPSNGNNISVTIRVPYRNVAQVGSTSVRITSIAERPASIMALKWTVANGVGTAVFDRQKVIQFLQQKGVVNKTIWIVVEGSSASPSWSFSGRDSMKVVPGK